MNRITEITRRGIFDAIVAANIGWAGRLSETDFLSRIFNLKLIPSTDSRFSDAAGDIWQHRVNNNDWDDNWIFYDDRFGLMDGEDDLLLRFLCEMIHPVVRSDSESQSICQIFNQYLHNDGFEIVEKMRLSGKPVYSARYIWITATPGIRAVKEVLGGTDPGYITNQITRMETAVNADPGLAIGTAKELIETCCRTILKERGVKCSDTAEITDLVKLTARTLALTPDDVSGKSKAEEVIKRLLSNLGSIAPGVAELRNLYGTGHGKVAGAQGLDSRHAKLAVGAAATLAVFLVETYNAKVV